mgnify:CR=1 FL=1
MACDLQEMLGRLVLHQDDCMSLLSRLWDDVRAAEAARLDAIENREVASCSK